MHKHLNFVSHHEKPLSSFLYSLRKKEERGSKGLAGTRVTKPRPTAAAKTVGVGGGGRLGVPLKSHLMLEESRASEPH